MKIKELDKYFRSLLPMDEMERLDMSLNGLQAANKSGKVDKAAFAVDACMETFKKAAEWGADILFVHHGLFWGKPLPLTGIHFKRMQFLLDNNLALYACHLPLDMDENLGNNISVAKVLGLEEIKGFGEYKGKKIGFKGVFKNPLSCEEVMEKAGFDKDDILSVLRFGKDKSKTAGIITGSATHEVGQAVSQELDLFITGEVSHPMYHQCLEEGINLISAGHYATEVFGVRNVAKKVREDLGIETVFIDLPTGL